MMHFPPNPLFTPSFHKISESGKIFFTFGKFSFHPPKFLTTFFLFLVIPSDFLIFSPIFTKTLHFPPVSENCFFPLFAKFPYDFVEFSVFHMLCVFFVFPL